MPRAFVSFAACLLGMALLRSLAPAAEWQPGKGPLMTRWAKEVSPDKVHPEYPRPQMVREQWTNLNGLWDYAVASGDKQASSPPNKWDGQILVPFPIESALSGVMKRVAPNDRLWYHRTIKTPDLKDGGRLLLHFGAVDWRCEVLVNGKKVGEHTGGYDPFTFDITDALDSGKSEQTLVVGVSDPTDTNWQPRGKQVEAPKGIWYTPTTGIWQTVWLEHVPKTHIAALRIVPDLDENQVRVTVEAAGDKQAAAKVTIEADGVKVAEASGRAGKAISLAIPKPRTWSPSDPFLYNVSVSLPDGKDSVKSYVGMRKIALGKDKEGMTRILLNGNPLFQFGPLDQGFWPDGLYTAPTDAAMKYDLEVTQQLGFNMIRKHVKVEPARWYYYCDKMGILVWQDMPSGDKYIKKQQPDIERTAESARDFEHEWREIMTDLAHFPSIVMWVPFNEGWGQYDTARIAKLTKEIDPSRLVDCPSGWQDRGVGDVHDIHVYPGPNMPPVEPKRAAVLGEFGGLGLPLEGHTWQDKNNWGYRSYESREALSAAYKQLIERLQPLIGQGLSAAVYTQTTDVEIEVNGFLTYDREVLKLDPKTTSALHKQLEQPAAGQ